MPRASRAAREAAFRPAGWISRDSSARRVRRACVDTKSRIAPPTVVRRCDERDHGENRRARRRPSADEVVESEEPDRRHRPQPAAVQIRRQRRADAPHEEDHLQQRHHEQHLEQQRHPVGRLLPAEIEREALQRDERREDEHSRERRWRREGENALHLIGGAAKRRDHRRVEHRRHGVDADDEDAAERAERQQARADQHAARHRQRRQDARIPAIRERSRPRSSAPRPRWRSSSA